MSPRPGCLVAACLALAGCAQLASGTLPRAGGDPAEWTVIRSVRFEPQRESDDCGPAVLGMLLQRWGLPRARFPAHSTTVAAGELRDRARQAGLQAFALPGSFDDLAAEIGADHPVIIGIARREGLRRFAHFLLVVGHDRGQGRWLVADPDRGWRILDRDELDGQWRAAGRTMVVASPDHHPRSQAGEPPTADACPSALLAYASSLRPSS